MEEIMELNGMSRPITQLFALSLKSGLVKPETVGFLLPRHVVMPNVLVPISPAVVREQQTERLISLGYPKASLRGTKEPKSIFALLVIPPSVISLKKQLTMAGLSADREDIYEHYTALSRNQREPYWIYNIGTKEFVPPYTVDSFPGVLKKQGKRGLCFAEGVNLFAQWPNFFLNQRYGSCHGFVFFGVSRKLTGFLPKISVFSVDIQKGANVGPNGYGGDEANFSTALTCSL